MLKKQHVAAVAVATMRFVEHRFVLFVYFAEGMIRNETDGRYVLYLACAKWRITMSIAYVALKTILTKT